MKHNTLIYISIISILTFVAIILGVHFNESVIQKYDSFINSLNTLPYLPVFEKITQICDPIPTIIIIVILSLILIFKKRIGDLYLLIISSGIGLSFSSLFKSIFKRNRPEERLLEEESFSLPSNHSTMATILGLSLIFSFIKSIKRKGLRRFLISLIIFISLLISASRFILKVHWLSDVVAGIALGTASFFISSIFLYKSKK